MSYVGHVTNPGESIGYKFIPSKSELFRFISISVSEPMQIISNQSEKCFVSRSMKNGQKSIRLNPINSKISIRINPNSDWSKPNFQSESTGMNPRSEWFGLILIESFVSDWFGFIWIDVLELIGFSRIDFWPLFIERDTKHFSEWFGTIRIGSDTNIRINRNSSDFFAHITLLY